MKVLLGWFVLALVVVACALPRVESLGLYYDEAFLAQQARDFTEPARAGVHPPSVTTTTLAGRPFPIRNAAYLGSLKSQLLIPSLAAFGSSPKVLRVTTLCTGLLGLLLCMLWIARLFDDRTALITGALVASDPTFYFFSQFEWGPFTSMLLCRGAGLWLLAIAFGDDTSWRRWPALVLGAAAMGLGVYSRVDFVVILAALFLGALLLHREVVLGIVRDQAARVAVGAGVFLIAVTPVIVVVGQVLGAGSGIAGRGDFAYRAQVFASTLDGSHFYRLLSAGGLFEEMFADAAPTTSFPYVLGLAAIICTATIAGKSTTTARPFAFALLSAALIGVGMLAIPGAVRAHHMLNVLPLAHLVVATAGVALWDRDWASSRVRAVTRGAVLAALLALLIGNAQTIAATNTLIDETGGVGRFSLALQEFVGEIDSSPEAASTELVSFDWGFHEPALFVSHNLKSVEPIWSLAQRAQSPDGYRTRGSANTVYLIHEAPYDLFGYSALFARALRFVDDEHYAVREHNDRAGALVFKSIRFTQPHTVSFDGVFRIRVL